MGANEARRKRGLPALLGWLGGVIMLLACPPCFPATRPPLSLRIRGHMKRVFGAAGLCCIVVAAGAMSVNGAETTLAAPTLLSPTRRETIDDISPLLCSAVPGATPYHVTLFCYAYCA